MSEQWSSNATLEEIAKELVGKRRIVVTTHLKPDGDAVGSSLALVRALNTPGPWVSGERAEAWYFGPTPPWLRDIAGSTPHRVLDRDGPTADVEPDAIVVVDTGSWTQLEPIKDWLAARYERVSLVDHHVQGDAAVSGRRHVDTSAAAACQPVAELCRLVLGVKTLADLPSSIAEALYLGLATDTGWFRHSNVNHRVMETAGQLLDAKADNVKLYTTLEQRESLGRLKLLARALASLEVVADGRLAVMHLRREDFKAANAAPGESGGFVDFGQSITGVLVTAVLTEGEPGEFGGTGTGLLTKVSLRSKVGVDVNVVAKRLGGGGHVQAAGCRVAQGMEEAKARVVGLVEAQLDGRALS